MDAMPNSYGVLNKVLDKQSEISETINANQTFYVDPVSNQIIGKCDGIEAVKQTFEFLIATRRGMHRCFTANWGVDFRDLIGRPDDYIISELLTRVQDAIKPDDRIISVDLNKDYPFEVDGDSILINFEVETVFGTFESSLSVKK